MKLLCLAAALVLVQIAQAAPFADPTRPPTALDATSAGTGTPEGPRLESVLIAPDRRVAVINGQQVVVGARIAAGEIVRISEGEVVIRAADRLQTLKLVPETRQPAAARKKGAP
jgi:hypothetical protein